MELEWAEAEIRLLPGVYACSAAPDGVVVFVDPVHDAAVTTDAVMALLGIFGISLPVRMLGGAVAPVRLPPARTPVRVPAAAAAVAAAAILVAGAASALTSLTGGSGHRKLAARPPATVPLTPTTAAPVATTPPSTAQVAPSSTLPPASTPPVSTPAVSTPAPASSVARRPGPVVLVSVHPGRPTPPVGAPVLHVGQPAPPPAPTTTAPTPPATSPTTTSPVTPAPTIVVPARPVTVVVPAAVIASVVPPKGLPCSASHGDEGRASGEDGAKCHDGASGDEDRSGRDREHEEKMKEDAGSRSAREASSTSAGEHG